MRRRIEIAVTDLPQPLSPTIASVSPSLTWKETPSTARLTPSGRAEMGLQILDLEQRHRSDLLRHARIERVAQAVAEEVHGEHRHREEDRREEDDVGLHLPERAALRP